MMKYRIPLLLQCLVFLIPVNIYVIGDWLGAGVQWVFFRYQQTYLGNSLILVTKDMNFVLTGVLIGRTGISILFWGVAVALFIIAAILLILATIEETSIHIKKAALCTITGGSILAISTAIQYGISFSGKAGFAIPVGIPVIIIIGWWMYRKSSDGDEAEPEYHEEEPAESD
jgi:hypothetical protein